MEEPAPKHQVQAVQGEMLLAVVEEVLAEHCSLEEVEAEVMFLASSVVVEEALQGCFEQAAEVGQVHDLEVEVVRLTVRGCQRTEVGLQISLPQAGPLPVLASSAAEGVEEVLLQHRIVLERDSAVEEVGWRTCQHLRAEEVP